MPATKKDIRNKKNRALEAAGLRAELTQSGVPVKPKKQSYICTVCRTEIIPSKEIQLIEHAKNKHPKEAEGSKKCFPTYYSS